MGVNPAAGLLDGLCGENLRVGLDAGLRWDWPRSRCECSIVELMACLKCQWLGVVGIVFRSQTQPWSSSSRFHFLAYLLLWTFFVSGGLRVASGLAAHTLVPTLSRQSWGAIHALLAFVLVWMGTYHRSEQVMKGLVALMFTDRPGCCPGNRPFG